MGRHRSPDAAGDGADLAWSAPSPAEPGRHERHVQWTGVIVAAVVAVWAAVLVFAFSRELAGVNWWLAPALNLGVVAGLGPVVWGWRVRPVLRFLAVGLGIGVALGWIALGLRWR